MTEKQAERIKSKIAAIKKEIAREKKQWGGYHDGRGLRYAPPQYYMQLNDFKGAMTYFRWFSKTFPNDSGAPSFLFEWTITLFKNGKHKEAEKKTLETFMSNTYLIDTFLKRPLHTFEGLQSASWQKEQVQKYLPYSIEQEYLRDFSIWLNDFIASERYIAIADEYISIEMQLINEPVGEKRSSLVNSMYHLLDNY